MIYTNDDDTLVVAPVYSDKAYFDYSVMKLANIPVPIFMHILQSNDQFT